VDGGCELSYVTGLYVCHPMAMFYNRGLLKADMRADFSELLKRLVGAA